MTETRMVPLSKIKDNPWRDRVRNPIDTERVEAIATSIGKTKKYWQGTYGREVAGGFVELAFGHHRFEAAKAEGLKEIPITIEDLTDGEMLVWMAQENVRGELPVVLEAVSAAVKALGEGKIEIEAPDPKTKTQHFRYAPSFIPRNASSGTVPDHAYTASTLARYLGYVDKKQDEPRKSVYTAIGILEQAEIAAAEGGDTGKKKAAALERSFASMKVNDAAKAVSDIKQREAKVAARTEEAKKAAAEFDKEQRAIQAQLKAVADKAAADRAKLVEEMAKAEVEEQKKKVKEIQAKIAEKEKYAVEKKLDLEVRAAELDKKVEQRKVQEAEAKREDAYLPIKREAERILHKLEGDTSTTKEALVAEIKSLARQPLNNTDRERLRQAALNYGTWYYRMGRAAISATFQHW